MALCSVVVPIELPGFDEEGKGEEWGKEVFSLCRGKRFSIFGLWTGFRGFKFSGSR